MDKNQAIIEYLIQCPAIANNPLFFNFANAKDKSKQIVTLSNDKTLNKPFIDGSVEKRYTFTIVDYQSVSHNAVVKMAGITNENVADMFSAQSIIDWVNTQNDLRNYPNFGTECVVESIEALTESPSINGVDTSVTPNLARYSVSIRVNYIDNSKSNWNNMPIISV